MLDDLANRHHLIVRYHSAKTQARNTDHRKETALPDPTTTTEPTIQPLPQAEESLIQPGLEEITIAGAQDLLLQTTLYTPGGSEPVPGVILLHILGGGGLD